MLRAHASLSVLTRCVRVFKNFTRSLWICRICPNLPIVDPTNQAVRDDFAATFTTPFDYVAKFISTDSAAFIVLQDSNSTDNYNRIGAVGDSI